MLSGINIQPFLSEFSDYDVQIIVITSLSDVLHKALSTNDLD
jgi:hypothetical protein